MKQLVIVLSFCTFAYRILLPGYLTLKSPQSEPDLRDAQRKGLLRDVKVAMKVLIRKFNGLFQIKKAKPMPFPWRNIPNFNPGVFTPRAWLKVTYMN